MRIDRPFIPFLTPPGLSQAALVARALTTARAGAPAGGGGVGFDSGTWTYFDQDDVAGDPNACGTTTLSMILAHYGLIGSDLASAQAVDRAVRQWGGFSAPDDLEKFAESKGLHSEGYNDSSFNDLVRHLSAGRTVMAMVDGGSNPHWVAVLSVETVPDGTQMVTVADPATGAPETMTRAEFEAMWAEPNQGLGGFANDLFGYSNFLQVFDTKPVPPARDFDIAYAQAAGDGISDMANGIFEIRDVFTKGKLSGLISGPIGVVGGLISTLSAVPGALGRIIEMGGDRVLGWAGERWNKGGFGNKVLGALGFVGGGILKGLGWTVKTAGNVVARIGQGIGSAVTWFGKTLAKGTEKVWDGIKSAGKAIGEGVKKAGEAIADGVKSVGKAIGKGIKKIFSGW